MLPTPEREVVLSIGPSSCECFHQDDPTLKAPWRVTPFSAAAGTLALVGVVGVFQGRGTLGSTGDVCNDVQDPRCGAEAGAMVEAHHPPRAPAAGAGPAAIAAPRLAAAEACGNVGYLCAELEIARSIRLRRWKDFSGTLVVHVPRPDFESPEDGIALQQAAAIGLRAWNRQPFEISTDTRGDRQAHFAVRWVRSLGGSQIGMARTEWSGVTGLRVISLELATRNPYDPSVLMDPRQIRLTAAHEMGHALGLPHSNAPRDVMYPTNTATSMSAQDYRTMESLYALPDGTEILR